MDGDTAHPLLSELATLRLAVSQLEHEAHSASLKLQHQAQDVNNAQDRLNQALREKELLKTEIDALRSLPHPDTSSQVHPASLQVQELTLSLRKLSVKLSLTEDALEARTRELAHSESDKLKAVKTADGAYELAARLRGREEEGKTRERDLEFRARAAEEALKMSDAVVKEYARLVRSLEGRADSISSPTHNTSLIFAGDTTNDRNGLQTLLGEFNAETERLQHEISSLHGELSQLQTDLNAEKRRAQEDRERLGKLRHELQLRDLDDSTAAKMVSRYMKFSQASTDALQTALETSKKRQAATLETLMAQLSATSSELDASNAIVTRLWQALDNLGHDIMRESYGRRREVTLRIRLVRREEQHRADLSKSLRRAEERWTNADATVAPAILETLIGEIRELLDDLLNDSSLSDSAARILVAENALHSLQEDLERETRRRLDLETMLLRAPFAGTPTSVAILVDHPSEIGRHDESRKLNNQELEDSSTGLSSSSTLFEESNNRPSDNPLSPSSSGSPTPLPVVGEQRSSEDIPVLLPTSPDLSSHENGHEAVETNPQPHMIQPDELSKSTNPEDSKGDEVTLKGEHGEVHRPPPAINSSAIPESFPNFIPPPLHPLVSQLAQVSKRYHHFQLAFRDCHLSLVNLKKTIASPSGQDVLRSSSISPHIILSALDRLNDFSEDATVELEIRIADEALKAKGFETLLSMPSAIGIPATPLSANPHNLSQETLSLTDVERQAADFISGDDPSVQRAQRVFEKKLDDLQHDIAALKQAIHQPPIAAPGSDQFANSPETEKSGSAWTSWIRKSSTPEFAPDSSGALTGPPPTFGNVMTTPSLRHSPSLNLGSKRLPSHLVSSSSSHGSSTTAAASKDPFVSLGLRVSMPTYVHAPSERVHGPNPRTRTVSTMYALGIGARGSNSSFPSAASSRVSSTSIAKMALVPDSKDNGEDQDSDVE